MLLFDSDVFFDNLVFRHDLKTYRPRTDTILPYLTEIASGGMSVGTNIKKGTLQAWSWEREDESTIQKDVRIFIEKNRY